LRKPAYLIPATRRPGLWVLPALGALCAGGCPFVPTDGDGLVIDSAVNSTFATADIVSLGDDDQIEFSAAISSSKDADIFNLGVLAPGDRLYVDVWSTDGSLDPLAAVFDEREYIHAFNDDRTPLDDLDPLLDIVIRGPAGLYYLGVVAFPGTGTTGAYRVRLQVTRDVGLPEIEPQVLYLDWEGGRDIEVANVGVYDLTPFDAVDLGFTFAGQTEELKGRVEAEVAERYEGYDLTVLSSDEDPEPTGPHSTVYFGGKNPTAFAIAEKIDTHNADQSDDTIIFTGSFDNAFSITPSLEQMVTAIANTVAHEVGHLFGLVHTEDCASLMDGSCGNDSILFEQEFKAAPLDDAVFPIGYQNARELLEWTLGLVGM
jgi:hypothetical protein